MASVNARGAPPHDAKPTLTLGATARAAAGHGADHAASPHACRKDTFDHAGVSLNQQANEQIASLREMRSRLALASIFDPDLHPLPHTGRFARRGRGITFAIHTNHFLLLIRSSPGRRT